MRSERYVLSGGYKQLLILRRTCKFTLQFLSSRKLTKPGRSKFPLSQVYCDTCIIVIERVAIAGLDWKGENQLAYLQGHAADSHADSQR